MKKNKVEQPQYSTRNIWQHLRRLCPEGEGIWDSQDRVNEVLDFALERVLNEKN